MFKAHIFRKGRSCASSLERAAADSFEPVANGGGFEGDLPGNAKAIEYTLLAAFAIYTMHIADRAFERRMQGNCTDVYINHICIANSCTSEAG